jgi:hypothetical protein
MRARHIVSVAAVILIGLGVTLFFLTAPSAGADANAGDSSDINVLQMHHDGSALRIRDLTLILPDEY